MLPRRGDEHVVQGRLWGGRNDRGPVSRVILQPGEAKERRLLVQNGPESAVWLWPGPGGQVATLGSAALFTPLADTDLTAFDLQMPFLYWSDFVFEGLAPEQIELQRTRILEGEDGVTHMHYRVQH